MKQEYRPRNVCAAVSLSLALGTGGSIAAYSRTPESAAGKPVTRTLMKETRKDSTGCSNPTNGVLITIDDWSYAPTTKQSINRLKAYTAALDGYRVNGPNQKPAGALIFPINQYVKSQWPESVKYLRRKGIYVGNHSWSHPLPFTKLNPNQITYQMKNGVDSNIFRAPGGGVNNAVRAEAKREGKKICGWTVDTQDYTGIPAKKIEQKVLSEVKPGSVVLMHLNGNSHSLEALQNGLVEKIEKESNTAEKIIQEKENLTYQQIRLEL